MNLLYKTSFLLLAPAFLSSILGHVDITIAILACFITSIATYGRTFIDEGSKTLMKTIDIITLHVIGTFYIIIALEQIARNQQYLYIIPIACSGIILTVFWVFTRHLSSTSAYIYQHAYYVHFIGSIGVCLYSIVRYMYSRKSEYKKEVKPSQKDEEVRNTNSTTQ